MSIQNVLVKELLRLTRKPIYTSEHTLRQHIARDRKKEKGDPPPSMQRACQIERGSWQEVTCYTMRPFHGKGANGHVLYLHGGGYVFEMVPPHWQLLANLINRSDVTATVPLYPLASEHTYRDTYPLLLALYQHLCDTLHPENLTIMGDSAGGGLALALALRLRDAGASLPAAIVVLSPWTDLALTGASLRNNAAADPIGNAAVAASLASHYLAGGDPRNPYASPLYGEPAGLPPSLLQVGSDEILLDDSVRMADRMRLAGCEVALEIWPRMPHVWHAFAPTIPEAGRAITRVGAFVQQQTARGRLVSQTGGRR